MIVFRPVRWTVTIWVSVGASSQATLPWQTYLGLGLVRTVVLTVMRGGLMRMTVVLGFWSQAKLSPQLYLALLVDMDGCGGGAGRGLMARAAAAGVSATALP